MYCICIKQTLIFKTLQYPLPDRNNLKTHGYFVEEKQNAYKAEETTRPLRKPLADFPRRALRTLE